MRSAGVGSLKRFQKFFSFFVLVLLAGSVVHGCDTFECNLKSDSEVECFEVSSEESSGMRVQMNSKKCNCSDGILLHKTIIDGSTSSPLSFDKSAFTSYNHCQTLPTQTTRRYNGEQCSFDDDCFSNTCGECVSPDLCTNEQKICRGIQLNSECDDDSPRKRCDVSLICHRSKCIEPVNEGSQCTQSEQCKHDAICFESKCIKIGTISTTSNDIPSANRSANQEFKQLVCETSLLTQEGKCLQIVDNKITPAESTANSKADNACNLFNSTKDEKEVIAAINWKGVVEMTKSLRESIQKKNKLCPSKFKFSEACLLISSEIKQLAEMQFFVNNIARIREIPMCLVNAMAFSQVHRVFFAGGAGSGDASGFSWTAFICAFIIILIPVAYYLFKQQQSKQKSSETEGGSATKKLGEKQYQAELQQAEQLSLEFNPASGKRGNSKSDLNAAGEAKGLSDRQKQQDFDVSVDQNIFSIEGGIQDEEATIGKEVQAEDLAIPQSATTDSENKTESDVSFDDVFNADANSKKPRRSNRPSRKKIVKVDSEKYKVVDE